jgi:hypothetical protein
MGVTPFMRRDYSNKPAAGTNENKVKQSQSFDFAQDRFNSVRCSADGGQRKDEEKCL